MTSVMTHYPWHVFFSVCFRYALIGGDLTAQSTGSRGTTRELEVELTVEFKFQRRSWKLSFLFTPRRQSAPESLLTGYTWQGQHNRAWLHVHVAWSAHCQILLRFQLFHILQESNQWNRWATRRVLRVFRPSSKHFTNGIFQYQLIHEHS